MVTHDQEEAQSMADRIFVMKDGEIIQSGTPREIYEKANSPFIADFIGITNFIDASTVNQDKVFCKDIQLECNTTGIAEERSVKIAIRPESILISQNKSNEQNCIQGTIKENEFLGSFQRLYVESPSLSEELLMIDIANTSQTNFDLNQGSMIYFIFPPDQIKVYPNSWIF